MKHGEMFRNVDSERLIARAQAAAPKAGWECPVEYVVWGEELLAGHDVGFWGGESRM